MMLTTRLTVAMLALVLLTATAVGLLTYRNIEAVALPRVLERLSLQSELLAALLEGAVGSARTDVAGFRSAIGLNMMVRASLSTDGAVDGIPLADWRALAPRGTETILVVEDDALVRGYVIAQLESLGYTTLAAADGAAALALVDKDVAFDLLFTDVIMPGGMNGRQLADAIRRRRPSLNVLYTSGYTENAIVHRGRLDPGVALLNKPYRKTDLARKIRDALSGRADVA